MASPRTGINAIQITLEKKEGNEVKKIKKIIVQKPLPKINRLSIEGCGVRGTAIAGAIKIFEKYKLLDDIEAVAGTSAGAIAGLIIALGFSAQEGAEILSTMPLKEFMEGSEKWSITPETLSKIRQSFSILFGKDHSLSSGQVFLEWLEKIVARRFDDVFKKWGVNKPGREATFRDLVRLIEETKQNGEPCPYKYLYVTATDLSISSPECRYFSHEDKAALDMPLAQAVRKSGGFPAMFKLFESVLNHHKYGDGGMMQNLPEIFEHAKFDPPGYKHELHGNPGNLFIKVDSPKEIKQFIWGIYEEVPVETASQIADALYKAVSENTNAKKTREGRFVLPLSDGEYGTLQFSIDDHGKIKLITSAEKTTQEFLENNVTAAYEVEVYDSIEDWLEPKPQMDPDTQEIKQRPAKTLDEIDEIIMIYQEMRENLLAKERDARDKRDTPNLASQATSSHDPNNPTVEELDEQIEFFNRYFDYRRAKKRNPNLKPNFKFPEHHININPPKAEGCWHVKVMEDMEIRLKAIKEEINLINQHIEQAYSHLIKPDVTPVIDKLHSEFFDSMKHLVGFMEAIKLLEEEKIDLENKLNIKSERKTISNQENVRQFTMFCQEMKPLLAKQNLMPGLKAVLNNMDLYDPKINYRSMKETDNILFSLDLRDPDDRKLYLVAVLLYLENRKNKDLVVFQKLYGSLYPNESRSFKTMCDVSIALKKTGVDFYLSLYRIEELLHWFEKTEMPKETPKMDIDHILGVRKWSIFGSTKSEAKEESGVELKTTYNKKAPVNAAATGMNFPFFEGKGNDSDVGSLGSDKQAKTEQLNMFSSTK